MTAELTAQLIGKVIIRGDILIRTGLRIGGTTTGLKIGGVDQPVITDPFGRPYIPGSSLKGKMRSLIEKKENVPLNQKDGAWHECQTEDKYKECSVCKIWGILGTQNIKNIPTLTRLIVRDTYLDETSITDEMRENLELKYTEIKMEIAIDRSTGTVLGGSLRSIDRVPAGAKFSPMEIIYNVYEEGDKKDLVKVFEAMELLEHDYLGGMGSRGYGKVKFDNITIYWNKKEDYETGNLDQRKIYEGKLSKEEIEKDVSLVAKIVQDYEERIKPQLKGGE